MRIICVFAALFLLIASHTATSGDKTEPPVKVEQWRKLTAETPEQISLTWKALKFGFKSRMRVDAGDHPISLMADIDGKSYALVPAYYLNADKRWVEELKLDALSTGCYWSVYHYLPVDIHDGQSLAQAYSISKRMGNCVGKQEWSYELEKVGELSTSAVTSIKQFNTESEYRAHVQQIQSDAEQAKRDDYVRRSADNESKQKIGARLCKVSGNITYVGFTENVSPDNGKVQLRISSAFQTNSPSRLVPDIKESIIWEDPTLWDLCEVF